MASKNKSAGEPTPGERINAANVNEFLTLQKIAPNGALQARKLRSGSIPLYWRFTFNGKTDRVRIGFYDPARPPKSVEPKDGCYSIAAAALAAQGLAQKHEAAKKDGGHHALAAAESEQRASMKAARDEASKQTLEALALAYCGHIKSLGRSAHKDAQSIFNLHVIAAFPLIAKMPAAEVTDEQVADMLRRLFDLKKGRTANKLRAYLRAAYEVARKAKTDPKIPVPFKAFKIRFNPAAATAPSSDEDRRDKNPLSADEMRRYWRIIEAMPGRKGALLRLHLLTGGQRIEQLVKLKLTNIGEDTITLLDGKGRPGKPPRPHYLPLLPAAVDALQALVVDEPSLAKSRKNKGGGDNDAEPIAREYAISTDGGVTHVGAVTLSRWAVEAVGKSIPKFRTKRLRSGVETLLASAGVSKDVRGRLQSHGVSGVQAAHYDAHDYLPEKLAALETLQRLLATAPTAKVVAMNKNRVA